MKAIIFTIMLATGSPVIAATFEDPTWPCLQRKVESLSLGIMWPHPVSDDAMREDIRKDGKQLAETLALRRVDMADGETLIDEFMKTHPKLSTDDLGHIFRDIFVRISNDRTTLISGIGRYSLQQIALSEAVDETRAKMASLMDMDKPDFDLVDQLEEKLDWDERVFRDRAQSLTYICETPVLLEKRIYAIAQIFMKYVPD